MNCPFCHKDIEPMENGNCPICKAHIEKPKKATTEKVEAKENKTED